MKLAAFALDYDGTIAVDGVLDPGVRDAIAVARRQGIMALLVTGRRIVDLRRVAGDLTCFDVVVAENGAVLDFPVSGRHVVLGHYLGGPDSGHLIDAELAGYILVTYRVSGLAPSIRATTDAVVMVTRETDPYEAATLLDMCRPQPAASANIFRDIASNEAALLPGAEESQGEVRRFTLAPRLTSHVRHQTKYLDMPVSDHQAFVFTENGRRGPRAHSLKEFMGLLSAFPPERIQNHLLRHDFSRWLADVFRDHPLAGHVRDLERRAASEDARDLAADIAQSIRARYEIPAAFDESLGRS